MGAPISETQNTETLTVTRGEAKVVRVGKAGVIIAVGNMLSKVIEAAADLDVSILYYATISPFDSQTLLSIIGDQNKIAICEPYYAAGGLVAAVSKVLNGKKMAILNVGMSTIFSNHYGSALEHDIHHNIDVLGIKNSLDKFINE